MNNSLKKIVAPVKGKDGKKPFWLNIGIMGMKNGSIWMKFNCVPTGWDGYCMGVEMDQVKPGEDRPEEAHPQAEDPQPEGYVAGSDEGPGY